MNPLLQAAVDAPVAPPSVVGPIAHDLEEVERVFVRSLHSNRPHVSRLVAHLSHYRGKRLRPTLLLLTAQACGGVKPSHHILGAVVEMIHTATLVHDDVLDSASVRRHVATVNSQWDNKASILLGDFLFTHAFHLAAKVDARACELIGEATNRVCEGELQQVREAGNLDLTEEEYFSIIDGKTAELTACCCRLGAIYSGASPAVVESMAKYGRALGMAFQIADDLLDLLGEERTAGKSLGTDLEQQKLTLPLIRLLRRVPPEHATMVGQLLRTPGNHQRTALASYFAEVDAIGYAQRRAEEFANQGRAELACLPASECRAILEGLLRRVIHRDR
jgi:octaprenyl-diphosphate synthase